MMQSAVVFPKLRSDNYHIAELQELSEKINDLADYQSDHAYDATSDMLDDMADSYEKEKQKEIDISACLKQSLYNYLFPFPVQATSFVNLQYGSYLNAILETQRQIASYESSSGSNVVGVIQLWPTNSIQIPNTIITTYSGTTNQRSQLLT